MSVSQYLGFYYGYSYKTSVKMYIFGVKESIRSNQNTVGILILPPTYIIGRKLAKNVKIIIIRWKSTGFF